MTEEKKTTGRGCIFYGFVTVALVFLGVIAGIYFGTRKAVQYAIEAYTTNAPAPIPLLRIPPAEQRPLANALLQRFEAAANKQGPDEMVIGEDDLNVLIAQSSDLRAFNRHIYLQPQGQEIKAFVSLPLDQFNAWKDFAHKMGGTNYTGRYLNGIAYINLALTNGLIKVVPRKMVVSAKTLPDQFIAQFPWGTLTQPINTNQNFHGALERVESISVKDSQVHVKFRR